MNSYKFLKLKFISKDIIEVVLNNPKNHNALSEDMINELEHCFEYINKVKKIPLLYLMNILDVLSLVVQKNNNFFNDLDH